MNWRGCLMGIWYDKRELVEDARAYYVANTPRFLRLHPLCLKDLDVFRLAALTCKAWEAWL